MTSLLLRGLLFGFAVAASPGPIFFLCFRRTLLQGRLVGLASGLGVATVDAFYAAVATFGVATLAAAFASGRRPLAVAGGVVLIAFGIRALVERPTQVPAPQAPNARGLAWAYASTAGLTITNPATIVAFAALAATLGLGTSGDFLKPAAVVTGVLVGSAAWWCCLAFAASGLRTRMTPGLVSGLGRASGFIIALLGILAIASAFTSLS